MPKRTFLSPALLDLALELLARYQRVEVEGLEHLPARGPAILLPNHSGFLGLDALLLRHEIRKLRGRTPRILLHKLWFAGGLLEPSARRFGFLEASYANGLAALRRNKIVMLFPEGEEGNFKPTHERYRLREFRKGFVKMAARTGAPVIPVLIIGAEETHINLGQVKILNQLLPLPLNYFPLPAKWKIKLLEPVRFAPALARQGAAPMPAPGPARRGHPGELRREAAHVRHHMQAALREELARRRYIYLDKML
jgi:1-acyl-sn-glycerol-3-phosphate acyltransferase